MSYIVVSCKIVIYTNYYGERGHNSTSFPRSGKTGGIEKSMVDDGKKYGRNDKIVSADMSRNSGLMKT